MLACLSPDLPESSSGSGFCHTTFLLPQWRLSLLLWLYPSESTSVERIQGQLHLSTSTSIKSLSFTCLFLEIWERPDELYYFSPIYNKMSLVFSFNMYKIQIIQCEINVSSFSTHLSPVKWIKTGFIMCLYMRRCSSSCPGLWLLRCGLIPSCQTKELFKSGAWAGVLNQLCGGWSPHRCHDK